MMTIKEWIKQPEVKERRKMPIEKILVYDINRDPNRAIYYNPDVFYSPADGFILYSKIVEPDELIVEVKGENYTVNSLLREEIEHSCLVIGIFMTSLDVHINRMPTDGFVTYQKLEPLKVMNLSMRPIEKDLLEKLGFNTDEMKYGIYNERMRTRVFVPRLRQHYYILQIADFEVDVIVQFEDQSAFYNQGERFSLVRMGSQVDLILPFINPAFQFESLIDDKELFHIKAGIDALVRIDNVL